MGTSAQPTKSRSSRRPNLLCSALSWSVTWDSDCELVIPEALRRGNTHAPHRVGVVPGKNRRIGRRGVAAGLAFCHPVRVDAAGDVIAAGADTKTVELQAALEASEIDGESGKIDGRFGHCRAPVDAPN